MPLEENKVLRRQMGTSLNQGIKQPFGDAKSKAVTPSDMPTSRVHDRVVNVPSDNMSTADNFRQMVSDDGFTPTRLPPNANPGPASAPWVTRELETVQPGNNETVVLTVNVPNGKVFRIKHIGHTYFGPEDTFKIKLDDERYFNQAISPGWSYNLGTPTNMYELPVTIRATQKIECIVQNGGAVQRDYEFVLDGWFEEVEYLQGTVASQ